jgi:hypothetical protein
MYWKPAKLRAWDARAGPAVGVGCGVAVWIWMMTTGVGVGPTGAGVGVWMMMTGVAVGWGLGIAVGSAPPPHAATIMDNASSPKTPARNLRLFRNLLSMDSSLFPYLLPTIRTIT